MHKNNNNVQPLILSHTTILQYLCLCFVHSIALQKQTMNNKSSHLFISKHCFYFRKCIQAKKSINQFNTCPQTSLQLDLKPKTLHCEQAINKNKIFPLCLISPHLTKMYSCSHQTLINTPFIL